VTAHILRQATLISSRGTNTSDTLSITGSGTAITSLDMTDVTLFEKIVVANNKDVTLTLNDANVADGKTMSIDASKMTSSTSNLVLDLSNETNGDIDVIGGSSADTITISSSDLAASIDAGAGNDKIVFASANLTSIDVIDGGAGTDTLQANNETAIVDADFTNVTNVEVLSSNAADNAVIATIGAEAMAQGFAQ